MEVLLVEQQVLVLRVDIDELFAQLLQHGQRHGRVVDEGSAFAGSGELAADDGVFAVVVDVVVGEERLHVVARQVEVCLDDTAFGTLFQRFGVGALS